MHCKNNVVYIHLRDKITDEWFRTRYLDNRIESNQYNIFYTENGS